ncbi:hypothetical protein PG984_011931 [Apiospora sp. TS-2023a]
MPSLYDVLAAREARRRQQRRRESPWPVLDKSRASLSGLILWLPSWRHLREYEYDDPGFDEECYGHPVVVLSPQSREGAVEVLTLTSFNGTDLKEKYSSSTFVRGLYLPIFPSNRHPDNARMLFLEPMWPTLLKNSYVNTRTIYTIDFEDLRPYDPHGPDYALSTDSYQELITYCRYQPPAPPSKPTPEPEPQPTQTDPLSVPQPPTPEMPSSPADSSIMPPQTQAKSLQTNGSSPAVGSLRSRVAVPSGPVLTSYQSCGTTVAPTRSMLESTCSADGDRYISRRVWQACACRRENVAEPRRSRGTGWAVILTMSLCVAAYAYYWVTQEPTSHGM